MPEPDSYDVFLSYNSLDRAAAERVADWLADQAGLRPFFDRWELIAGDLWIPALQGALGRSRTCAILIGPHGTSPWVHQEMQAALVERARNPQFRIIPVFLPGTEGRREDLLPRFLQLSNWIELRESTGDPEGLHALAAGIRGTKPGRWPGPVLAEGDCPYRGLQAFEEEHSRFFFGREAASRWLAQALGTDRFLAVVGPSGSGKSSLVRAGLVPELRRGGLPGGAEWSLIVLRPGRRPLEQMALAFTRVLGPRNDLQAPLRLMDQLAADRRQLHFAARMVLENPEARILLVVDQLEEIFTLCPVEEERLSFLESLLYATEVEDGPVSVVVTLRADFYGRCAALPDLAARITQCQMLVGPMSQDELRSAIERPARLAGMELDPGLVETILDDLRQEPGSLPLLQHALLEIWNQREGHRLTFAAYRRIGGVRGAIAHRAEAVFAGFEEARKSRARRLLLRLTQPGEGTEDTRRRVTLAELLPARGGGEEVEATLQALVQARLLTTGTDERGEVTVDIAHEALIRHWGRFRTWIEADRDALRTHRRLTEAAEEWERSGRDESYLYAGARLAGAEEWCGDHGEDLSRLEREFLDVSRARHEERQERELTQTQALLEAERQRVRESERLRLHALALALALQASQRALNPIETDELSALLALQAYRLDRETRGYALGQVDRALRLGLSLPQFGSELPAAGRLAFSPDSRRLASGEAGGVIRLWDMRSFHLIFQMIRGEPPLPHLVLSLPATDRKDGQGLPVEAGIADLVFSPDGRLLAVLENGGTITVWDLERPEAPQASLNASPFLASSRSQSYELPRFLPRRFGFSPRSRALVLGGKDGVVRLWDLDRAQEPPRLLIEKPHDDPYTQPEIFSLMFRPDGLLAIVRLSGRVEIRDPEHPSKPPEVFSLHEWSGLSSFKRSTHGGAFSYSHGSFSPSGAMVAEATQNHFYGNACRAKLWRLAPSSEDRIWPLPLKDAEERSETFGDIAISPGDRFLAASTWTAIKLWNLERPALPPLLLPGSGTLAFSPDGKALASDRKIWPIGRTDPTSATVLRLADPTMSLAFHPEGTILAVSTLDSIHLCDLRRPEAEPLVLELPVQRRELVRNTFPLFSQDGRKLAVLIGETYRPNELLVWDLLQPEAPPLSLLKILSEGDDRSSFDFLAASFDEDGTLTWFDWLRDGSSSLARLDLTGLVPGSPCPADALRRSPGGKLANAASFPRRYGSSLAALTCEEKTPPGQPWLPVESSRTSPLLLPGSSTAGEETVGFRPTDGRFRSFAVSERAGMLAAGGENTTVALWAGGQPEAEPALLFAYQKTLLTLAFSPDGTMLAGGGDGATVQLWDLRQPAANPAILEGHRSDVLDATFSPDSRFLATGDQEGTVRIWIARTETLADLLSSRVGREMTEAEWRQFAGWAASNTKRGTPG